MSAYAGYRLKINGTVFPNAYMQRGTWSCNPYKRQIRQYHNAAGTLKEDFHKNQKVIISFNIRESNLEEHEQIAPFFLKKENVEIEYWNDDTCTYETAVCSISDVTWKHSNALTNEIFYKATAVKIIEY